MRWIFYLLSFCLLFRALPSPAQTILPVETVAYLPPAARWLALGPDSVRGNYPRIEAVLDLAEPLNLDSTAQTKRRHHPTIFGTSLQLGGYYWEYLDRVKQKFVGSSSRPFHIFEGWREEHDVNIFLMPHLPHYIGMVRAGIQAALREARSQYQFRYDNPPFQKPEELRYEDKGYFTVECEVTPPLSRRAELAKDFFPTTEGDHSLKGHPNFGDDYPVFGTYGVFCLDCNHGCRPEIHPIEWLWWLDVAQEEGLPHNWEWMVSLMRDGSKRFDTWSADPLRGTMAIPIAIPASADAYFVRVEPITHFGLDPKALATIPVPAGAWTGEAGSHGFRVGEAGPFLHVEMRALADAAPTQWWVSGFQQDPFGKFYLGYLHVAAATSDVYAVRIVAGLE